MSNFSTEEKVRIVLDGMRYPEDEIRGMPPGRLNPTSLNTRQSLSNSLSPGCQRIYHPLSREKAYTLLGRRNKISSFSCN